MSTPQSIIIYQNPVQAAFWEGGYFIPLAGGLVAGFLTMLLLIWIADRIAKNVWARNGLVVGAMSVASLVIGLWVFNLLFI